MKEIGVLCAVCLLSVMIASLASARPTKRFDATTNSCRMFGDGQAEWDTRAWGEGGKLFKEVCKSCHSRDSKIGAPYLWEESKTSNGWNRVFAKKYPKCAKDGSWDKMTLDQQLILNDYLYRWSKDSQDLNDSC